MTDRARVALLPDETLVEDLPLRRHTINALRFGGVLTFGQLRVMSGRELIRLRQFGPGALADVRFLVPPPGGSRAVDAGDEMTIAGRAFRIGATYASALPRSPGCGGWSRSIPRSGGLVVAELRPPAPGRRPRRLRMSGDAWARRAGKEVGD